jgi:hypothetical protein
VVAVAGFGLVGAVHAAGAGPAPVGETVGGFAVRLATALQLPGPRGGFTSETAAAALWSAGVRVQPALGRTLTEKDVTETLAQVGFALTTQDPGRVVSTDRADAIVSTLVGSSSVPERIRVRLRQSVASGGGGDDDFNNGNGKGGKFKRKGPKSPGSGESLSIP